MPREDEMTERPADQLGRLLIGLPTWQRADLRQLAEFAKTEVTPNASMTPSLTINPYQAKCLVIAILAFAELRSAPPTRTPEVA